MPEQKFDALTLRMKVEAARAAEVAAARQQEAVAAERLWEYVQRCVLSYVAAGSFVACVTWNCRDDEAPSDMVVELVTDRLKDAGFSWEAPRVKPSTTDIIEWWICWGPPKNGSGIPPIGLLPNGAIVPTPPVLIPQPKAAATDGYCACGAPSCDLCHP